MEPCERQLHLGLDAGDPGDAESRGLLRAVLQERGLAHPGLAAHDQDRAPVRADAVQQPVERLAFGGAAQQTLRSVRAHGQGRA
jgi:hypothetical protein